MIVRNNNCLRGDVSGFGFHVPSLKFNVKHMQSASDKFYDRFTMLYPLIDVFVRPQKRKFFDIINSYPSGKLLEIGVGNGSHFRYYAMHDVIGIDTSGRMLAEAKKRQTKNIELIRMNGEALAFASEMFDYVILSHVIAVVQNPEKVLEEVHRVLKPKGKVFILNHFTPKNGLQYLDMLLTGISRLLHFKSVFHIAGLRNIQKFKLSGSFVAGPFSYFKILVYEKNV
jgi:phosphatidylethanolamine/phosphatidyl-N-methylethanolamine N-methyltransferase